MDEKEMVKHLLDYGKEHEKKLDDNEFFDPDAPVEVFDPETVKKLLKEKDNNGEYLYTKKEIAEAKNETERLMMIMEHLQRHGDESKKWRQVEKDEDGEYILKKQDTKKVDYSNMTDEAIVANYIEFDRTYTSEEEHEMRRGLSEYNQYLVGYIISLINMYHKETDMKRLIVPHDIRSIKDLVKFDKARHETFMLDPALVEVAMKAIKLHNGEMNASKKKKIQIATIMPSKKCDKYGFSAGQVFESQNDLIEYCKASGNIPSKNSLLKWKKTGYLKEI